jgi:hypothetical protein
LLIFGSFTFGVFTLPRTPRFLLLRLSAIAPATPTSAAPPAIAGPFAFSAIAATVDWLPFRDC